MFVRRQLDCHCIPQAFFPFALIKFDIEKEEPVRNSEGLCIPVGRGRSAASVEIFAVQFILLPFGISTIVCFEVFRPLPLTFVRNIVIKKLMFNMLHVHL